MAAFILSVTFGAMMHLASQPLRAADDSQPQIAAAAASAVDHLFADVSAQPISAKLTVGQFLDKTRSAAQLRQLLAQAQQIGGPRWLDPQTCQIRLDIAAAAVRDELRRIAIQNPQSAPVSPDELSRDLSGWQNRVFSATGVSTAGVENFRPPPGAPEWAGATEEDIRRAVGLARMDAARHVLDAVATVPAGDGKTVHDVLLDPDLAKLVTAWLESRPVMQVEFHENREVELILSVSGAGLCGEIHHDLELRRSASQPAPSAGPGAAQPDPWANDAVWQQMEQEMTRRLSQPVARGRGAATQPAAVPGAPAFPLEPMDWVDKQLDTDAQGTGQNRLQAARDAQNKALAKLGAQVAALPIGNGRTMADMTARDPQLAAALDRAITRGAHLYNVEYRPDGSTEVRMSLNLRDLWQAIAQPR